MEKTRLTRYVLLSLIGVAVMYIIPFAVAQGSFELSLLDPSTGIFSNQGFTVSFKNTIIFMLIYVPIVVILGFLLAYATEYMKLSFVVQVAIILPIAIPILSVAGFFRDLSYSVISKVFNGLSIVGLIYIWSCLGFTYLIFLISLKNRNKSIEEAAYLDGAGTFRTLFKIIIPLHSEALVLSIVISIYNSLKIFKQTYAIFGEYPNYDMFMMQNFLYLKLKKLSLEDLIVSADIFLIFIFMVLMLILALGMYQKRKLLK
ncbi:MAG TPA: hypothetical protein DC000_09120 [Clostridiales bacterium]|nr:hypothetical protein [Clostridiales bacterium]